MPVRDASAVWEGGLKDGKGTMSLGSGAYQGSYSFGSRFEQEQGTNPEELIAAAHAGCFSMALSLMLGKAGFAPRSIRTTARVHLDKQNDGFAITRIDLQTEAEVPDIDAETFQQHADNAKAGCPVSKALSPPITLDAKLL